MNDDLSRNAVEAARKVVDAPAAGTAVRYVRVEMRPGLPFLGANSREVVIVVEVDGLKYRNTAHMPNDDTGAVLDWLLDRAVCALKAAVRERGAPA